MIKWWKTNKKTEITLEEEKKCNLALTLLQNTYSWYYVGSKGEKIKLENVKLKYKGGFTFYK